ncbi:Amine oxidase, flavin-containing [Rubrivivax sp. A210]|uniref:NAD(P)/FAD-dependent oxidoreductase n=1 Tax=Rubrivivax sp. A210 TaxID=2772301 RepID=UPI001918F6D6|nr:FAD-dependent oxidoreductase [Rubrivivax sp. A210]CAD5367019.1 Amine oxidase, flavin-containing [Rubrivivax sp. A210]
MKRVAVIGSGISGLAAARSLQRDAGLRVTLFESEARFGGHANTVDVTLPDAQGRPVSHGVDTGFLVYNERTYPRLIALFAELGVATAASDMSFSVQAPRGLDGRSRRLEWNGSTLDTVFAQRRNIASPRFLWMLREVLRFNALATRLAAAGNDAALTEPLAAFLERHRFGAAFAEGYLLPMIACIWSCPLEQMLRFPVATLIRFCHNHGLLQVNDRPQWRTVAGGSRLYVQAMLRDIADARCATPVRRLLRHASGVDVYTDHGPERFDALVLACHAPQALALLGADAMPQERTLLSRFRTQPNVAVLHTDTQLMPQARKAWAAWNFERAADAGSARSPVCLHYWINALQPLPFAQPVIVSLNPVREPRPGRVLARLDYAHPVFDSQAIHAQGKLAGIQGLRRTWFCGAWTGYGFHEDGLKSGLATAGQLAAVLAGEPALQEAA